MSVVTKLENKLLGDLKNIIENGIDSVISGAESSARLITARPGAVERYIQSKYGVRREDDFETNGWEWDYWIYFIIDGTKYQLSGDGFYNNSATFCLYIDEDY